MLLLTARIQKFVSDNKVRDKKKFLLPDNKNIKEINILNIKSYFN